MRLILILALSILTCSCNDAGSSHRGYVISKSQETSLDIEPEDITEQEAE